MLKLRILLKPDFGLWLNSLETPDVYPYQPHCPWSRPPWVLSLTSVLACHTWESGPVPVLVSEPLASAAARCRDARIQPGLEGDVEVEAGALPCPPRPEESTSQVGEGERGRDHSSGLVCGDWLRGLRREQGWAREGQHRGDVWMQV